MDKCFVCNRPIQGEPASIRILKGYRGWNQGGGSIREPTHPDCLELAWDKALQTAAHRGYDPLISITACDQYGSAVHDLTIEQLVTGAELRSRFGTSRPASFMPGISVKPGFLAVWSQNIVRGGLATIIFSFLFFITVLKLNPWLAVAATAAAQIIFWPVLIMIIDAIMEGSASKKVERYLSAPSEGSKEAEEAVVKSGDATAELLVQALLAGGASGDYYAAIALRKIGAPAALPLIRAYVLSADPAVQSKILSALPDDRDEITTSLRQAECSPVAEVRDSAFRLHALLQSHQINLDPFRW